MFIINKEKKVFVGKRLDSKTNTWQMPQGGIDGEETIIEAVLRETHEETGITSIEILRESKSWYYYDLPMSLIPRFWNGQYRGQKQKWVLLKFNGSEEEIDINKNPREFLKWQWIDIDSLPNVVIPFKKKLYQSVIEEFYPIINNL